jgi:methyl-accepting chemotaxis protein
MSVPPRPPHLFSSGQRRVFLVKRNLQIRIILLVLGAVAAAIGLIGLDLYRTIGQDIVRDLMDPGLYGLFKHAALVTAVKMGLYLLAVAFLAMLLSNKMAGPLYRFERSMETVSTGDLTHRVHLRKGDELQDFQGSFNAMLQSLHERGTKDAALAARVAKQLDDMSKAGGLPPEALRRLQEIKAEVEHITAGFKV